MAHVDSSLDIVIPCLNAAGCLPATLAALCTGEGRVIVADGGSSDDSVALARAAGARAIAAPRGRGPQLAAGAAAGQAPWLLFLHADTRLGSGWWSAVRRHVEDPANRERAGYFRLRFDCPSALNCNGRLRGG